MKTNKPNWTPLELYAKYKRWEQLIHDTESHIDDCQCNLCLECFGLGELMMMFETDEHAQAVIDYRKSLGGE